MFLSSHHAVAKAIVQSTCRYKGRTVTDFGQVFDRAIRGTRSDLTALPSYAKFPKAMEEFGEFGEACLHRDRFVAKEGVGTPIEEAADVILMLVDILSDQYEEETPDRIVAALEFELMRKLLKWEKYMNPVVGDRCVDAAGRDGDR